MKGRGRKREGRGREGRVGGGVRGYDLSRKKLFAKFVTQTINSD